MRFFPRALVIGALGGAAALSSATPAAAAADPGASCVGVIVSNLAPQRMFDVNDFKALGEAFGAPTFGQFVSGGAREHLGSLEACVPVP